MKDYGVSVLEQYEMEVHSTRRVRGAVLCDTEQGPLLLKEAHVAESRLPVLVKVYALLEERGMHLVDEPLANREGGYLSRAEDGALYMLRRWFDGRECDVRRESELIEGARRLAELHKVMRMDLVDEGDPAVQRNIAGWGNAADQESASAREASVPDAPRCTQLVPPRCPQPSAQRSAHPHEPLLQEYQRHNRELRKVRSFIQKRSVKGEFETTFLQGFEEMYRWALLTAERLEGAACEELYREAQEEQTLIHGDYNYHNLLFCPEGLAVTGFDRAHREIQMADFYYFLRKTLEKHHYDERLGYRMLRAYDGVLPLGKAKREYLAIRLAYPEKFWKTANLYYHSNKAWIPAKSVEKLRTAIRQAEEKKRFLEHLFAFHL